MEYWEKNLFDWEENLFDWKESWFDWEESWFDCGSGRNMTMAVNDNEREKKGW